MANRNVFTPLFCKLVHASNTMILNEPKFVRDNFPEVLASKKYKIGSEKWHDFILDIEDLCSDQRDAVTCCGVTELTDLEYDILSNVSLQESIAAKLLYTLAHTSQRAIVYYGIDANINKHLKSFGFKETFSFVNPSTKNKVTALVLVR